MSIQYKTIAELRSMLDSKAISSKEVVEETFKLIDKNNDLNAFITLNKEASIAKSIEIENNPVKSALHGIPIAQKDLFCTKDLRTTCGSNILSNFIPPYSATVIENLENAGCISVGKTNMDEFAMGSSNETSFFGGVRN
ncbi:MAG: amidase, partial [SAR86 cluster bacterium]|nr:amidase [SAR86 cluster bacterium]